MKSGKTFLFTALLVCLAPILKGQRLLIDSIIHQDSIRHLVEVLAADSMEGRLTGSAGNQKAALFISDQFEKAGIYSIAGNRKYFIDMKPGWSNVVGAIPGKSKKGEIIIFSAHYDHVGTIKSNPYPNGLGGRAGVEKGDTIYNGANDNASGVSAVISLAKYFKALNNNERTLIFVAFTGEELGLLGSTFFAKSIVADSVIAVINIEMIGRSESNKLKPFITGPEKSELKGFLNNSYQQLKDKNENEFFRDDPYKESVLFMRSDNFPFAQKGIPAHSIMLTSPFDKYYHNLNDEAGTLNYGYMKKVIQAIAVAVNGLVFGNDTPKRIRIIN